ncbi:hypothetical protein [uncultured Albimonas sp.]|uniref:hypothetical protein n=1 Tax=uncultured Albimonas sp. TaxID=1331701 RepID=UPI0030EBBDA7|tara:strand:- start:1997 stop:3142 length:1146 start_codon:yes stop_codon:yes gene_type:complete
MPNSTIEADVQLTHVGVAAAVDGTPLRLIYDLTPHGGSQGRVRGRLVATPRLNLSDYKVSACVDWIDLKFRTIDASQNQHVSKKLQAFSPRTPFVTDWSRREGADAGTHKQFIVRLQEPGVDVLGIADAIDKRWGLDGHVKIAGLEVSLDIFPKDGSDEKRWLMTTMLARSYVPLTDFMGPGLDQMRCFTTGPRGETVPNIMIRGGSGSGLDGLAGDPANHHPPMADGTTCFGAKGGPVMVSIQNKISDRRMGRTATSLPPEQRRTRVEVRLLGAGLEALGLHVLGDLDPAHRVTNFAHLRPDIFSFRLPTFDPADPRDGKRREIFSKTGVYGLERHELPERDARRCGAGTTIAFSALNDRLQQALTRLDDRSRRGITRAA